MSGMSRWYCVRTLARRMGFGGCLALVALVFLSVRPPLGLAQSPASAPASGTIHVTGHIASKELADALVAEFARGTPAATLDFRRNDYVNGAAAHLLEGRQIVFTIGQVTDVALGEWKARWKALQPRENVVGGKALAIVVHARSNLESLTLDQVRDIFSGRIADWKVLGGAAKSIRRYGTALPDAYAKLFDAKVLSLTRCAVILRKKDAAEVLEALDSDPDGIAFVDAGVALLQGGTVKVLAVGEARSLVRPNAQTLKDGSYPLSEVLVMYVHPRAGQTANDFAQFVLSEKGSAICREHGFVPGLRAVQAEVNTVFQRLYGAEIKRVMGTPHPEDDIALGRQILQSARTTKMDADLLAAMCEGAYDLGANAAGGTSVALDALRLLAERVPDQSFDCARKRVALYEKAYLADKSLPNGDFLIDGLTALAEQGRCERRHAEAAAIWRRALTVAEEVNSTKTQPIKDRLPAFTAREETAKEAETLAGVLAGDPKSAETRKKMFWLQLVELDEPAEAQKYLDASSEEAFKSNTPLAAGMMDRLPENASLRLAEWYQDLADRAGAGGKELMARRARDYYLRFLSLHRSREDVLATRAELGLKKIAAVLPEPLVLPAAADANTSAGGPALAPVPELTDVQLAEYVSNHPDATVLTKKEIGSAKRLTDLRPLAQLTKLTQLELDQAENVKDLSPLARLTNLRSLSLVGCGAENLAPLSGLSRLTALTLSRCRNVKDLSPLSGLTRLAVLDVSGCRDVGGLSPLTGLKELRFLRISGCEEVSDLTPLSGMKNLTSLTMDACPKVEDLSPLAKLGKMETLFIGCRKVGDVAPLRGLTELTSLILQGCEQIADLSPLDRLRNLTTLNLRDCLEVSDLAPVSRLGKLRSLILGGCPKVKDLAPLANLSELRTLDLRSCDEVASLAPLEKLTGLQNLNIVRCGKIDDGAVDAFQRKVPGCTVKR